jgi:hypothetical protein
MFAGGVVGKRLMVAIVVVAVCALTAVPGDAAALGGVTTPGLTAITMAAASGAPTVIAWENFDAANNSDPSGTTTDGGSRTWNASNGTWKVTGNQLSSTSSDATLVVNTGFTEYTLAGRIFRNGATNYEGGFAVAQDSGGSKYITCELMDNSSGSIEIWKNDGSWARLAFVTNLWPTAPASFAFSCAVTATTVVATVAGFPPLVATLTAGEITTFKAAMRTYGGIYQYESDGLTWDDVHVDRP